jgi:hypothetical protein
VESIQFIGAQTARLRSRAAQHHRDRADRAELRASTAATIRRLDALLVGHRAQASRPQPQPCHYCGSGLYTVPPQGCPACSTPSPSTNGHHLSIGELRSALSAAAASLKPRMRIDDRTVEIEHSAGGPILGMR